MPSRSGKSAVGLASVNPSVPPHVRSSPDEGARRQVCGVGRMRGHQRSSRARGIRDRSRSRTTPSGVCAHVRQREMLQTSRTRTAPHSSTPMRRGPTATDQCVSTGDIASSNGVRLGIVDAGVDEISDEAGFVKFGEVEGTAAAGRVRSLVKQKVLPCIRARPDWAAIIALNATYAGGLHATCSPSRTEEIEGPRHAVNGPWKKIPQAPRGRGR